MRDLWIMLNGIQQFSIMFFFFLKMMLVMWDLFQVSYTQVYCDGYSLIISRSVEKRTEATHGTKGIEVDLTAEQCLCRLGRPTGFPRHDVTSSFQSILAVQPRNCFFYNFHQKSYSQSLSISYNSPPKNNPTYLISRFS